MFKRLFRVAPLLVVPILATSLEGSALAAQWHQFTTPGQTMPVVAHNFVAQLGASNWVTLAPIYQNYSDNPPTFLLYVVSNVLNPNGDGDRQIVEYDQFNIEVIGTWTKLNQYYTGIVANSVNAFVGWTQRDNLFLNDSEVATSVSGYAAGIGIGIDPFGVQTSTSHSCAATGETPGGHCLFAAKSAALTSWTNLGVGGDQVTTDMATGATDILDSSGVAWELTSPPSRFTSNLCLGGSTTFTQIAAKSYIYALSGGEVYKYPGTSSTCWSTLGAPPGVTIMSIATDNSTATDGVTQVWGSDSNGNIWQYF